jgi:hypothetical protein
MSKPLCGSDAAVNNTERSKREQPKHQNRNSSLKIFEYLFIYFIFYLFILNYFKEYYANIG